MTEFSTYLELIRSLVLRALERESVDVALFGSMARGDARRGSDVDVAVIPRAQWNRTALIHLRTDIEDLKVPWKVEIVDFSEVSETFSAEALSSAIWWRKAS